MASYKRTIYLIDPKFQLKFSLFVTTLVLLSSMIYPLTIYGTYNKLVEMISDPNTVSRLENAKHDILMLLVFFQLIFAFLVFIICIFQSHKIAGPIYKLKKYLRLIKDGQTYEKLFFRKGDNFTELADEYNSAMNSLNVGNNNQINDLNNLLEYLSNKLTTTESESEKEIITDIINRLPGSKR